MIIAALITFVVVTAWIFLLKLEKVKNSKFLKSMIAAMGIILLCEALVFNAGTFRMIFCNSPKYEVPFDKITTVNVVNDGGKLTANGSGASIIEVPRVGCRVDTIHFNISNAENFAEKLINVSYSDITSKDWRKDYCKMNYIAGNSGSEYMACSFSGEVDRVRFEFKTEPGEKVEIESIVLNEEIPFHFSLLRIFTLMLIVLPITALFSWKKRDEQVDMPLFKRVCIIIAAAWAIVPIGLGFYQSPSIVKDFKNPSYNQINYELVNAFKAGQVSLLDKPSDELMALENPYDESIRDNASALWDHVYYNGKYYSYYGIAPVILLFLPYHLITGAYFPSLWACVGFCAIGCVFLALTYYTFVKKFFPKISNAIAIFGLLIAELSTTMFYSAIFGNFYEIAQSSGFAAVTAGAYFLLRSNAVGEGKNSLRDACISSILLALAVLCRPTLAVYCIAALFFIFFGAKKVFSEKRELVRYLCASLIPFAVIGLIQMTYNSLRFGSPFEFGIQYSLTINDFTKAEFHLPFVFIALYNYLFAVPLIQPVPPFASENFNALNINGFYFSAGPAAIGLFIKALPTFGYVYAGKAWRYSGRNKKGLLLTLVACVIAPLVIIYSIWESGFGPRYAVDFNWQLLFGAYVILFVIYSVSTSRTAKNILLKFFAISFVVAFIIFVSQCSYYLDYGIETVKKAEIKSYLRLFDFLNIF